MKPTDMARLRRGLVRPSTVVNAVRIVGTVTDPVQMLRRYVNSDGDYPWRVGVRTPTGTLALTLGHPHDVRTVNEIFSRNDYGHDAPRVVVDIGANIGVASAYFASRHPDVVVHAWEPVPHNLELARRNLAVFGDRVTLHEKAVAPQRGRATFSVEPVGRYSGLTQFYEHENLRRNRSRSTATASATCWRASSRSTSGSTFSESTPRAASLRCWGRSPTIFSAGSGGSAMS